MATPSKDPVVEEIREIRRQIEAENNGDFKKLFQKNFCVSKKELYTYLIIVFG